MDWLDKAVALHLVKWIAGTFLTTAGATFAATGNWKQAIGIGAGAVGAYLVGKVQESPLPPKPPQA